MLKKWYAKAILFSLFAILLLCSCTSSSPADIPSTDIPSADISLVPVPALGNGIYRISGDQINGDLIWSPNDSSMLLGLISEYYLPMPDCPPFGICFNTDEKKYHSDIFLLHLDTLKRQTVVGSDDKAKIAARVFWLPDGKHIGYILYTLIVGEKGTWSIDLDGRTETKIYDDFRLPVWNADGSRMAVVEIDKILVIDTHTGQEKTVFMSSSRESDIYGVSWSPDGSVLAFSYGETGSLTPQLRPKIYFLDLQSNSTVQLPADDLGEFTQPSFSPKYDLISFQRYQRSFSQYTSIIEDINKHCQIELPRALFGFISWSPDGLEFVVHGEGGTYIVNLPEYTGVDIEKTGSLCP